MALKCLMRYQCRTRWLCHSRQRSADLSISLTNGASTAVFCSKKTFGPIKSLTSFRGTLEDADKLRPRIGHAASHPCMHMLLREVLYLLLLHLM